VHDGKVILESSVICQYVDEVFPSPPLLPSEPFPRARAPAWLKTFDDVVHPAIRRVSFELLYRPLLKAKGREEVDRLLTLHPDPARAHAFRNALEGNADRAVITESIEVFKRLVRQIDHALEREWLAGDAFSLADVRWRRSPSGSNTSAWVRSFEGRARGWMERVLARPSVSAARAPAAYRLPGPTL
jgi:glutathione S-transferase